MGYASRLGNPTLPTFMDSLPPAAAAAAEKHVHALNTPLHKLLRQGFGLDGGRRSWMGTRFCTSPIWIQEPVCSVQQAASQALIRQELRSRTVLHNLHPGATD